MTGLFRARASPARALSAVTPEQTSLPLNAWGLTKTWRRGQIQVLSDVELTVKAGDAIFIGGENGAGKTTLLRILSGLIGPDSGYVLAYGLDPFLDRQRFHRRVGLLSSGNQGLYARLSVRQQIDTWARIAFVHPSARAQRVEAVIEEFDLGRLAEQRSDRLSLGQRQRLRIALTFVAEPSLLLLDEPRTSLDPTGDELLRQALRRRIDCGATVVWVSPTADGVAFDFTRAYELQQGRLRESVSRRHARG